MSKYLFYRSKDDGHVAAISPKIRTAPGGDYRSGLFPATKKDHNGRTWYGEAGVSPAYAEAHYDRINEETARDEAPDLFQTLSRIATGARW